MESLLHEIALLRQGVPLVIDKRNRNRYRVVASEADGTRIAYWFSVPVYNEKTRRAVDLRFRQQGGEISATGSNAAMTITDSVRMENREGVCVFSLSGTARCISGRAAVAGAERLTPTTNGVTVLRRCRREEPYRFFLTVSQPFPGVRASDRCFALMSGEFRPFVSVSCVGTTDDGGDVIAPAKLSYQRCSDRRFLLTVTPTSPAGTAVLAEINLYEPKLIQDTTVESANPKANNAFGSMAFIGTTKEYGDQWLYARPDSSRLTEMNDRKILRAVLHLPRRSRGAVPLCAYALSSRFCSFGSTWQNKVAETALITEGVVSERYVDLDLTSLLATPRGRWQPGDGFLLRTREKNAGFAAVATGDHYETPQILEIHYK